MPGWSPLLAAAKFGFLGKLFLKRCALLQLQLSQDETYKCFTVTKEVEDVNEFC